MLGGIQAVHAAAETSAKHPHPINLPDKSCVSCHTQDSEFMKAFASNQSKCSSCHDLKKASNKNPVNVAAAQPGILNLKQELKHPKEKLSANAGMQFPIYYKSSRLGDVPNKMVLIPAGKFTMGSNNRLPDEGPEHTVTIGAYYIDIFEVTNLQYKKFNDATRRRSPTHFRNRTFPEGKADHPVT
ncbi:formylglycine-generating enzyme family protein, partial [Kaarinaea lacus]